MARILRQRYNDLLFDKLGLFGSSESTPTSAGGRGTWNGHVTQYEGQRTYLQKNFHAYNNRCGDPIPSFVYIAAQRPAPSAPTRYQMTVLDNILLSVPGSDTTWAYIDTGLWGIALTAGSIGTMGAIDGALGAAAEEQALAEVGGKCCLGK